MKINTIYVRRLCNQKIINHCRLHDTMDFNTDIEQQKIHFYVNLTFNSILSSLKERGIKCK